MRITTAVRHVTDQTRAFGPVAAFHDLQLRALNRVVPFQILKGMTASLPDIDQRMLAAPGFETRFASRDELLAATSVPEIAEEMSREFVESALDRGDECFALFDQDTLASFGWYSSRPTPIADDVLLHFDPSWVYMYKGYTLPAYRGKRLHGIGMSMALAAYTGRGSRGLISYVKSNNFQSLRSIHRMGYRVFGDAYLVRALGRVLTWATPGCQPYAFRLEWQHNVGEDAAGSAPQQTATPRA